MVDRSSRHEREPQGLDARKDRHNLAGALPIFVATSGWQYEHWRGRFYPHDLPQARWLEHYASRFRVVEVNSTFYRLPAWETFQAWAKKSPPDFVFALKVNRYLSHVKRLRDPEPAVTRFLTAARGLGPKLGPVLLQLSSDHRVDAARLGAALAAFPAGVKVAVELRHPSWWTGDIEGVLEQRSAALCWADRGGPVTPLWRTAGWGYVRFHGGGASPSSCYARRSLESWAARIVELWPSTASVFVFFNNDANGCAVRDAVVLGQELEQLGREVTRLPSMREAPVG